MKFFLLHCRSLILKELHYLRRRRTYPPIVKLTTRTFWDKDKFWNVVTANGGNALTACVKKMWNIYIWNNNSNFQFLKKYNLPMLHVFQPSKFYALQFLNISDIRKLIRHSFFKNFLMHMQFILTILIISISRIFQIYFHVYCFYSRIS